MFIESVRGQRCQRDMFNSGRAGGFRGGRGRGFEVASTGVDQEFGRRIRRRDCSCLYSYGGLDNASSDGKKLLEKRKEFLNERIKEIDEILLEDKEE